MSVFEGIRAYLHGEGYTVVQRAKKERLKELLDEIYVDARKQRPVKALEEARRLARHL